MPGVPSFLGVGGRTAGRSTEPGVPTGPARRTRTGDHHGREHRAHPGKTNVDEDVEVVAHSGETEDTPWCVINTGTTKLDDEDLEVVAHTADAEDTPWCVINTGTSN
ncbi:hypothetical protein [Streptomyces sp. NRRL B-24484]|uniref:hypothetical protein n=1 Tax=Streptomyces sp. NRRL B-24484 TaxID=1463833 RepID=UPI0004C1D421|nr:hypothetical protein [Streptomyces sp. NRRL B-24484]